MASVTVFLADPKQQKKTLQLENVGLCAEILQKYEFECTGET